MGSRKKITTHNPHQPIVKTNQANEIGFESLPQDVIIHIFLFMVATNVIEIPGTSERLNFRPLDVLTIFQLINKDAYNAVRADIDGNNYLGVRNIKKARSKFYQLKQRRTFPPDLIKKDIIALNMISDTLITQYPIQNTYYLGIGNSPAILLAFLKAHYPETRFANLPLGGIGSSMKGNTRTTWKNLETTFIRHFSKYLKNIIQSYDEGREIVVIDYAIGGVSLRMGRDFIIFYVVQLLTILRQTLSLAEIDEFLKLDVQTKSAELMKCKLTLAHFGLLEMLSLEDIPSVLFNEKGEYIYEQGEVLHTLIKEIKARKENKEMAIDETILNEVKERVKMFALLSPPRKLTEGGEDERFITYNPFAPNAPLYIPLSPGSFYGIKLENHLNKDQNPPSQEKSKTWLETFIPIHLMWPWTKRKREEESPLIPGKGKGPLGSHEAKLYSMFFKETLELRFFKSFKVNKLAANNFSEELFCAEDATRLVVTLEKIEKSMDKNKKLKQ